MFVSILLFTLTSLNIEAVEAKLDEVSFFSVISAASLENKTVAWVMPTSIRASPYLISYDYENQTLLELKDPRVRFGIFCTVIPDKNGFFVVDHTSSKIAHYNHRFDLTETSQLTHWQGADQVAGMKLTLLSPSAPGFGIATYRSGETIRFFTVDFAQKKLQPHGGLKQVRDVKTQILGAGERTYLMEPGLGNLYLYDMEQQTKGAPVFKENNPPLARKHQSGDSYKVKLGATISLYGSRCIQVNEYYDAAGYVRTEPQRRWLWLEGSEVRSLKKDVIGSDKHRSAYLIFNEAEQILELKKSL